MGSERYNWQTEEYEYGWWVQRPYDRDSYDLFFIRRKDGRTQEYYAVGEWHSYEALETIRPMALIPGVIAVQLRDPEAINMIIPIVIDLVNCGMEDMVTNLVSAVVL